MMDGISITLLIWLIGSHFFLYYRMGRIEEALKEHEKKIYKLLNRKLNCDQYGK